MAVARRDIGELLDVIERWVRDPGARSALLSDLLSTRAAQSNRSLRETILRLMELRVRRQEGRT